MKTAADGAKDFIENLKIRKGRKVLSTGFKNLDHFVGGLFQGELLLVGARPGTGKSAFLMQIAEAVARQGELSLVLSLEMSEQQLQARLLGGLARVDAMLMRSGRVGQEELRALEIASETHWLPNLMTEDRTYTLEGIESCIRSAKEANSTLSLVIVDYIQRVRVGSKSASRDAEIGVISGKLTELAKELGVCMVAAAQLNRQIETKKEGGPRKPQLSDLRESGSLEQDADAVIVLTREGTEAVAHVIKNRHGENFGECYFDFYGGDCRFVERVTGL